MQNTSLTSPQNDVRNAKHNNEYSDRKESIPSSKPNKDQIKTFNTGSSKDFEKKKSEKSINPM